VKGKEANGVGSQHSCTVWEHGLSSITTADAHTSAASSRLNGHPRRYKWTRPFRWKTKSGFCASAITFRFHSNTEARSCCFGNAISISYSEFVSAALDIQHAKRMHRTAICGVSGSAIFFHVISQTVRCVKKLEKVF